MPIMITDACVDCGACLQSCPNDGIRKGRGRVVIDMSLCTECVGFFSTQQCAAVCPIQGACVLDPASSESETTLFERARKIHARSPAPPVLSPKTSHFRAADAPKWWERLVPWPRTSLRDAPELEKA